MIPRLRPCLGWADLAAAFRAGRAVDTIAEFEEAFARLAKQKHAIAFPYGRTGLFCLLKALDLESQYVITPAWTCVVVPHAIVHSGNEPVFVDCAEDDYNMDLHKASAEATKTNAAALIATSIFGHPVDTDALDAFRRTHPHIPVIQDCAHSFFCTHKGRPVHKEGVAAIFGLNISKLMTSIFGGMVTTDDTSLAQRLRMEREKYISPAPWHKAWRRRLYLVASMLALCPPVYGVINRLERNGFLDSFVKYFDEASIDMPADWCEQITSPEAKVGIVQCGKYAQIVETRRKSAHRYNMFLRGLPNIKLPPYSEGATWSHYTILHEKRETFLAQVLKQGAQLGQLIEYNIPDLSAYKKRKGYRDCPRARMLATQSVNLPIWDQSAQHAASNAVYSLGESMTV